MDIKITLAKAALKEINDNSVIFLDGGSTMFELAKLLNGRKVTIITNNVLLKTLPLKHLILLPGTLLEKQQINLSTETFEQLTKYKIDKAFFGFSLCNNQGFYTSSFEEANFKKQVIALANKSFAIGDKNKKSNSENFLFADQNKIKLITI